MINSKIHARRSTMLAILLAILNFLSATAQKKPVKLYQLNYKYENILTNAYNNDLRICALVQSKKYKDSIAFYEYNFDKQNKDVYPLMAKSTWMVKHYGSKSKKDVSDLYGMIKAGKTVENAVIDTLDLSKVAVKQGNNWVINYVLKFNAVYIRNLLLPADTAQTETVNSSDFSSRNPPVVFKNTVQFYQCTLPNLEFVNAVFEKPVAFINNSLISYFDPVVTFTNAEFKDKLFIANDYVGQLLIESGDIPFNTNSSDRDYVNTQGAQMFTIYYKNNDSFRSSDMKKPKYQFQQSCIFDKDVTILNSNPFLAFDFSNSIFYGKAYMTHFYPRYRRNKRLNFVPEFDPEPDLFKYFPLCNINFYSAKFKSPVYLNNEWVKNVNFADAVFADSLFLFNTVMKDTVKSNGGFFHAHFSLKQIVMVNPTTFSLQNLNFNSASIRDIEFPYLNYNKKVEMFSSPYLDNNNSFYDRLVVDAKVTYLPQPDLLTELQNKYKHEQLMYRISYLKHNLGIVNGVQYLWLTFLEFTVGNGYHGGTRFFYSCLIMILFFSVIFFAFNRVELVSYINGENGVPLPPGAPAGGKPYYQKEYVRNFYKCFWQSFNIFFNPKYNFKYFQFSNALFTGVIVEWLLGIVMIILFLVYIAASYPFIHSILGI